MKKIVLTCVAVGLSLTALVSGASAAGDYPKKKPREQSWSFAGPLGQYDKGQLQRGFKVFKEVCAACHSMDLVAFRNLKDLGYSDAQIKSLAAEYEVMGEPNADGDVELRPAVATDYWPNPYENVEQAAALNNGAVPPDMSKLAMARAVERGFPTFVFDIATQYNESGVDYIYSLLTGYEEPADPDKIGEGLHYNPYFIAGEALAMANPLDDDIVDYDDGTPQTLDQYARDVSAFLMWAAEPTLPQRKAMGFTVIIFLIIFAGLLYAAKRKVWSDVKH